MPWTSEVSEIKKRIEEVTKSVFNHVQMTYYRDGEDYLGFRDDPDHFNEPVAILTLGSHRNFIIKHAQSDEVLLFPMAHGSLLIFQGEDTLKNYMVSVPKMKGLKTGRVVMTFRTLLGNPSFLKS